MQSRKLGKPDAATEIAQRIIALSQHHNRRA